MQAAMKTLAAGVKGKGACFQELAKFQKEVVKDIKFLEEMSKGLKKDEDAGMVGTIMKTVCKDYKIDGDTATATATLTVDGKDHKVPMAFKKLKGKWFIDLISPEAAVWTPGEIASGPPENDPFK